MNITKCRECGCNRTAEDTLNLVAGQLSEADWARTSLQEIVNGQHGELEVARAALNRYGRHHDNCESLKRRPGARRHRHCTCGYITVRHKADPYWMILCRQCPPAVGESPSGER
jgi:hypothetical protein